MAISDAVAGNLTVLYMAAIAAIKVYSLASGQRFSGLFVLVTSTTLLGVLLVATLMWDVSRKATKALTPRAHNRRAGEEACRGGICWHGVAVRSPASEVRFRLPQQADPRDHF